MNPIRNFLFAVCGWFVLVNFCAGANPPAAPKKISAAAFDAIGKAIRDKTVVETKSHGAGDKSAKELPADGALLVGFDLALEPRTQWVTAIRPVFQNAKGERFNGKLVGTPSARVVKLRAKPGYAVGAVNLKAGAEVVALSVTFMEVLPDKLNAADSYESDMIGGHGGGGPIKLGGDGGFIVGAIVRHNDKVSTGMTLLTAPPPEKSTEKKK